MVLFFFISQSNDEHGKSPILQVGKEKTIFIIKEQKYTVDLWFAYILKLRGHVDGSVS